MEIKAQTATEAMKWIKHHHQNYEPVSNPIPGQRVLVPMLVPDIPRSWWIHLATIIGPDNSLKDGVKQFHANIHADETFHGLFPVTSIFRDQDNWCKRKPIIIIDRDFYWTDMMDPWIITLSFESHLYKLEVPYSQEVCVRRKALDVAREKWENARDEFKAEPLPSYQAVLDYQQQIKE